MVPDDGGRAGHKVVNRSGGGSVAAVVSTCTRALLGRRTMRQGDGLDGVVHLATVDGLIYPSSMAMLDLRA